MNHYLLASVFYYLKDESALERFLRVHPGFCHWEGFHLARRNLYIKWASRMSLREAWMWIIIKGHVELLNWINEREEDSCDPAYFEIIAVKEGQLAVLEWFLLYRPDLFHFRKILRNIAKWGSRDMMKWGLSRFVSSVNDGRFDGGRNRFMAFILGSAIRQYETLTADGRRVNQYNVNHDTVHLILDYWFKWSNWGTILVDCRRFAGPVVCDWILDNRTA